jgi:hypothetical protein
MGAPPSFAGGENVTVAEPGPAVAATAVGEPGVVGDPISVLASVGGGESNATGVDCGNGATGLAG